MCATISLMAYVLLDPTAAITTAGPAAGTQGYLSIYLYGADHTVDCGVTPHLHVPWQWRRRLPGAAVP
jgi:hypothetical protein